MWLINWLISLNEKGRKVDTQASCQMVLSSGPDWLASKRSGSCPYITSQLFLFFIPWTIQALFYSEHFALAVISNPFGCFKDRRNETVGTTVYYLDSATSPAPIVDKNYWGTFLAAVHHASGATTPFDWRGHPRQLLLPTRLRVHVVKVCGSLVGEEAG